MKPRREASARLPGSGAPVRPSGRPEARPGGEVRIIGGVWKRSKLTVPYRPDLRPTPDRVRETLFNWLGQDLAGWRCVDAFAGSGALGFEAASRGASEVCLIEADAALARQLQAHATRLKAEQVRVLAGDALAALARLPAGASDVVFLDPPFGAASTGGEQPLFARALTAAVPLLAPAGCVYLEAPMPWTDDHLRPWGLKIHRSGKAGLVHYHLLVRATGDNPSP